SSARPACWASAWETAHEGGTEQTRPVAPHAGGRRAYRRGAGGAALRAWRGRAELGAHTQLRSAVRDAGAGPEYRGGLRGAARPGLHRLLCRRRLYVGAARFAAFRPALAVLGHPAHQP